MRPRMFRRGGSWVLAPLLLLALCTQTDSARAQVSRAGKVCTECHRNISVERERALGHADSLSCLTCHHVDLSNDPRKIAAARTQVCKDCHTDLRPTHTRGKPGEPACSACHDIHKDQPLKQAAIPAARCKSCHERPHVLHETQGDCSSCHTLHSGQPLRASDPELARKCVSCHDDAHPAHAAVADSMPACTGCHNLSSDAQQAAVPQGAALTAQCVSCHKTRWDSHEKVQQNAPECVDCHSFDADPKMPAAVVAVSQRCGSCHKEELKDYRSGGHAKGLASKNPNPDLPTCASCHPVHDPAAANMPVRLSATAGCVKCHSDDRLARKYDLPRYVGGSYNEDFHGATVQFALRDSTGLAQSNVMICSDCHGAHAVGWTGEKVVSEVCLTCHKEGGVKLAGAWLGHSAPGPRNQIMIWLARIFYYIMIPFVLTGLTILIVFQMLYQHKKGATIRGTLRKRAAAARRHVPMMVRFNLRERFEHLLSMITFTLLVITGLPQTRPDLGVAQWIIALFGGIGPTRIIHRVFGFIFVASLVLHAGRAIVVAMRKRRMPVMVPTRQDFYAMIDTVKHILGRGPRPKWGKFDFAEKFEYWGMIMGGTLMAVTGVALVYPEFITQYLPGVFIALFRTLHGLEATFAVLVIILWHSYGVILRPEIFPADTSIFTGKISLERLEEEHTLEYERLLPEHPEWEEALKAEHAHEAEEAAKEAAAEEEKEPVGTGD